MKAKKVELTELFYDLVFVYAISKMTGLIHHLHHGVISPFAIFTFVTCLLVVINLWIYQTVFINRYGKNTIWDNIALQLNMMCILFLSNSFTTENWESVFHPYALMTALTTIVLTIQYAVQYFKSSNSGDKTHTRHYTIILGIRSAMILLSAVLPFSIGIILFFVGLFAGVLFPFLIRSSAKIRPINFPHLAERFSLLVIITFGEMLIGIAPYFTAKTLGWDSISLFLIVGALFMFYIVELDHHMNHHQEQATGYTLVYWHYPIFVGLSFITVSLGFFNQKSNPLFLVFFLYLGLFLFYLGIYAQKKYNKEKYRYPKAFLLGQVALFILGFSASLLLHSHLYLVLLATTFTVIMLSALYISFTLARKQLG